MTNHMSTHHRMSEMYSDTAPESCQVLFRSRYSVTLLTESGQIITVPVHQTPEATEDMIASIEIDEQVLFGY